MNAYGEGYEDGIEAGREESAEEIERLRAALEAIAKGAPYGYKAAAYEEIARAALANQQPTKPD